MPTIAIRRLISGLRARYHVWNGRRAYRAGRLRAAGRHLDEALSCGHRSFSAYLLLGKVAYRARDMHRARECFRQARRADPARFALEGFPSGFVESLGQRPTDPVRTRYRIIIEPGRLDSPRPQRARQRSPSAAASGSAEKAEALGDFSSVDEFNKARRRPMLRPGEWADIDWDLEARKLFKD